MAFPFKTGGDFYNCEAQRMRLHNLGANPTETATGLMYFNTGASNLGKHAVVHDGTNFKALAFVDEIATNTAFTELAERVLTIEKALGEDTANVIDTWEEIQNFLKDINSNDANLMTMLDDKLSKSQGGTIDGNLDIGKNNANYTTQRYLRMWYGDGAKVYRGMLRVNAQNIQLSYYVPSSGLDYALTIGSNGLKYYDAGVERTLLHSGNIGDYNAGGLAIQNKSADETGSLSSFNVTRVSSSSAKGNDGFMMNFNWHYDKLATQFFIDVDPTYGFQMRHRNPAGEWYNWKTIAFTDSTVEAAKKLVTSDGAYMVYQTSAGHLYVGDNIYTSGDTHILGKNIRLRYGTSSSYGFILNSSGNVTIGDSDYAGTSAKLYVNGVVRGVTRLHHGSESSNLYGIFLKAKDFNGSLNDGDVAIYSNKITTFGGGNVLIGTTTDNGYKLDVNGTARISDAATLEKNVLVKGHLTLGEQSKSVTASSYLYFWKGDGTQKHRGLLGVGEKGTFWNYYNETNGNYKELTIGPNGLSFTNGISNALKFRVDSSGNTTIEGDLHVKGNIISDKEISAGGAGQEGESGDGGAEVISQQLASGQSTYTITNTIKRSDIAVSLYEWNANNGSWDMCLADISVKDATITVTFGSATSVNHKLVAVG